MMNAIKNANAVRMFIAAASPITPSEAVFFEKI
jgi:hypothetical protein